MSLELENQYDKIYKYCYFKVKNTVVAEDLTQETFLKYFNQTSYINRGKPLAYLYTIAKNLCIDHSRKVEKLTFNEEMISSYDMSDIAGNIAIKDAIEKLPEDLREIVLLRYVNELRIGEIACFLGISRYAIYRKLNKAISNLKTVLKKEDFYEYEF